MHVRVVVAPTGVTVADLNTVNGTTLNGQRLTSERQLRTGDVIRVGNTDLKIVVTMQ